MTERLYTRRAAADALGVPPTRLRELVKEGRIPQAGADVTGHRVMALYRLADVLAALDPSERCDCKACTPKDAA